ncbi:CBS domain-containing protein [Tepidiforma bonchosmolovskayae]|jgi:CBS domain-containing protein|uniref:CBS domain-containing protein n=1 Tax=Tepidiforma bonchosmolovskayae TaxID=2601677 RepID=A0ABX6C1G9_9CHLR|nr:CBS domain-containing protein [Tepidiforma bonchosmolovskayae]QFG02664.1 CBS domain-containing protein [Tepidiforma bonchosmolovskayae]
MKLAAVLATRGAHVATIAASAPIAEAVTELAARNIGALVVLDGAGAVAGIISERDIIRALAAGGPVLDLPVADVMTRDVICGTLDDDLETVLAVMTSGHFRHLPVVDGGQLVGLVTTGDLAQALLQSLAGRVETLEFRLEAEIEQFGVGR